MTRERFGERSSTHRLGDGPSHRPLPFERLGAFRLERWLGQGGMGEVYLARQESVDRQVALKIVRPDLQGSTQAQRRFQREAHALARLDHPHVLRIHDFGCDQGVSYLVTDLVPGVSLAERIEEWRRSGSPTPIAEAVRWMAQMADALAHVHEHGLIHRDVKPSNIHIRPDGQALLMDFGLVHLDDTDDPTITQHRVGSPLYCSPEQIVGDEHEVDHRSDVYSLGATMYEALTQEPPASGDHVQQVIHNVLHGSPTPPRRLNPTIPPDLQTVLGKAMEKDARRRYASAEDLKEDLDAVLAFRPVTARPPTLAARLRQRARRHPAATSTLITLVASLLAVLGWSAWQHQQVMQTEQALLRQHLAHTERLSLALTLSSEVLVALEREAETLDLEANDGPTSDRTSRRLAELDQLRGLEEQNYRDLEAQLLDRIQAAMHIDSSSPRIRAAQADLYATRWALAAGRRQYEETDSLASLVELYDTERRHASAMPTPSLDVVTDPPGATVHLFRYRSQTQVTSDGELRLVPCPIRELTEPPAAATFPPGTVALSVVQGNGAMQANDLIVSVDGHPIEGTLWVTEGNDEVFALDRLVAIDGKPVQSAVEANYADARFWGEAWYEEHCLTFETEDGDTTEVWSPSCERDEPLLLRQLARKTGISVGGAEELLLRNEAWCEVLRDGELVEMNVPEGTKTRRTATPLIRSPASSIGITPLQMTELRLGEYLGVASLPGYEDARFTLRLDVEQPAAVVDLTLWPVGTSPDDMMYIADGPRVPYWLSDHEVTFGEYAAFIRSIESSRGPTDQTRALHPTHATGFSLYQRNEAGEVDQQTFTVFSHAAMHLTKTAALAFVRWKNTRPDRDHPQLRYALPTQEEWAHAARGFTSRRYVYGDHGRSTWNHTAFSTDGYRGSISVRSYCRDESPYGVYDLSGNAPEWCWKSGSDSRDGSTLMAMGGSGSSPVIIGSRLGLPPVSAAHPADERTISFRLAAHVVAEGR